MKTIYRILFTALIALLLSSPLSATIVTVDGLRYDLKSNGKASVVDQLGLASGDVVIPSQITVDDVTYPVTAIDYQAFYECWDLETVTIPPSITSYGDEIFYECGNLKRATLPEGMVSIPYSMFILCYSLESVNIPESVTEIGNEAFFYCQSLKSVELPARVKYIYWQAFDYCTGLESFTCHATLPPDLGVWIWEMVDQSVIPLYVPEGSVELYMAAEQWKEFMILPIPPTYPEISLQELVALGGEAMGNTYTLTDELHVVALVNDKVTGENILLMKDDNRATGENLITPNPDDQHYLIHAQSDFTDGQFEINNIAQKDYDQSNWLEVIVPNEMTGAHYLVNKTVVARSVTGVCTDTINPRINLTVACPPLKSTDNNVYRRNAMTPANFVGSQKDKLGVDHFFMTPKRNEYIQVVSAVYHDGSLYCPAQDGGNSHLFKGRTDIRDFNYNYPGDGSDLQNGYAYQFTAIAKWLPQALVNDVPPSADAPRKITSTTFNHIDYTDATRFDVRPINLAHVGTIVTGIDGVNEDWQVESVTYYNLQGIQSTSLQPGMNIVVTRYTNGTTATYKIIK